MEVGDYVRTKNGEIGKIIGYIDEPTDYYFNCYVTTLKTNFTDTYITEYDNNIKSSPNIIDLIEVGDYVNGLIVEKNKYGDLYIGYVYCGGNIGRTQEPYATFIKDMEIEDIKSIVTREMFESMEYRIGD